MDDEPCVCCVAAAAPGLTAVEMKKAAEQQPDSWADWKKTYYGVGLEPIFSGATPGTLKGDSTYTPHPIYTTPTVKPFPGYYPTGTELATPNYSGAIPTTTGWSTPVVITDEVAEMTVTTNPDALFTYEQIKKAFSGAESVTVSTKADKAPIYSMGDAYASSFVNSSPQVTFEWTNSFGNKETAWCDAATVDFGQLKKDFEETTTPSVHHHDVVEAEEEFMKQVDETRKKAKKNKKLFKKKKYDGSVSD